MTHVTADSFTQSLNTQAFRDAIQDFRQSIDNIASGGNIPIADITTLTAVAHDFLDSVVEEIYRAFPQSGLNGAALSRTLLQGNAVVATVLEGIEVGQAWASGESIGQQLAGGFGAVIGAAVGGIIGGAFGLAAAPLLGAGLIASALTIGLTIVGASLLGGFLESYYENLYNEIANLFPDDLGFPDWLEDLVDALTPPIDPLVIDLDGDGIELTSLEGSDAYFDLDGDGFAENTAWVAPDDGLLAVDANGNGTIDDISEVFGSETETGYEQLAVYDTNGDGVVNADDDDFDTLLIWQDANGNGVSDEGELQTLSEAGITELNLNVTETDFTINGNQVIETSTVEFSDGTTTESGEVLFELSQTDTQANVPDDLEISAAVNALPFLRGFGNIADLNIAFAQDDTLVTAAEDLILDVRSGDFDMFETGFEEFLFQWGDVADETIWLGEAQELTTKLLYNKSDLDPNWVPPFNGVPLPPPAVAGVIYYVTRPDTVPGHVGEVSAPFEALDFIVEQEWIDERDLGTPSFGTFGSFGNGTFYAEEAPRFQTLLSGGEPYVSPIDGIYEGDIEDISVPDFDAKRFAFIQNLLGQEFSESGNFIAPDDVILNNPPEEVIPDLQASYDEMLSYTTSRFLVESVWTVLLQEGADADLGALEPFSGLSVNPFTDTIEGNYAAFVKNFIDLFRADGLGTDADALEVLAHFDNDIDSLGELVIGLFEDIDVSLIAEYLDVGVFVDGTTGTDTLTLNGSGAIFGRSGDDQIEVNNGESIVVGGAGDDIITSNYAQDTYIYTSGDGSDTIIDFGSTHNQYQDKLVFTDINASDVSFSQNIDRDLILTLPDGSTITLANHYNSHNEELELIEFADGIIYTLSDIDQALGTAGDDIFYGWGKSDNFYLQSGQGDDQVVENSANYLEVDTVTFEEGVTVADIYTTYDGNNLVIGFKNAEGTLTILNYADDDGNAAFHQVDQFTFSDGTTLSREEFLIETLGTAGNDAFNGSGENDTFIVRAGQGDDTLSSNSSNYLEVDTVTFEEGVTVADIYTTYDGNNLVIGFKNTEGTLTILNYADDDGNAAFHQVDQFTFSDGTTFSQEEFLIETLGTAGNDAFNGSGENDTFIVRAGQGDDTLSSNSAHYLEVDTVTFEEGVTVADIYTTYDGNNLVIGFRNAAGTLTILNYADDDGNAAFHQVDQFTFSDGTTLSREEFLIETLGTAGNDAFNGSGENDTFIVRAGQGDDTLSLSSSHYLEVDTLTFEDGITIDDIYAVDNGGDLRIQFVVQEGSLTILNSGGSSITNLDQVVFSDGTVLTQAEFIEQALNNALGNTPVADDAFTGTAGNDIFYVGYGQGDDTVSLNTSNYLEVDTVQFDEGITAADIYTTYDGDNLVIGFKNAEGTFTILNDGNDSHNSDRQHVDQFTFSDGTTFTREEFLAETLGTAGNDAFNGSGENDTFIVRAGQGDDTLSSNSSNYLEVDTLTFEEGITAADVYSTYDGDNLVIGFKNAEGTFTILNDGNDSHSSDRQHVDQFTFSDGTILTREEFLAETLGTAGDDAFNGSGENDTFVAGIGMGNDTILSNSSNYLEVDTLVFENGLTVEDIFTFKADIDGNGHDDLVIGFEGNTDDTITILNTLSSSSTIASRASVNQFTFEDGTTLSQADFIAATLDQTHEDEFIF
ncbi:hypothetical protein F9L33_03520 [Amylibacter sp. SFDW26]|uniref:beta strand repeat-containing protein n=1 Tax=Amylibacter sp. SFDW26 TaxID=2652722 RepID=UPI001261B0A4|nr:calcium-binding protein [Amylibacter sp. SFDW26]KAB7615841.1 hypothetical protein F9L33_03520 [Amylibacter sp. SFDW26]